MLTLLSKGTIVIEVQYLMNTLQDLLLIIFITNIKLLVIIIVLFF